MIRLRTRAVFVVALALGASSLLLSCSPRSAQEPRLMNLAVAQRTPDEFSVLPTLPLQNPPDYRTLPPPEPGARNRVDRDPFAEAAQALGGRPPVARQAPPAADAALLRYASRFGADPAIREKLAEEDLRLRQRRAGRPLERLFGANVYLRAYQDQLLDAHAELLRWRQSGVRTPAAPPPPEWPGR